MVGAVASLALVVGLGVWGYQLVMRDVSGVPVVRAVEGPMRAQPENPGGSQADHQGLAVNSVAANGSAEAAADRVTLAPQPIELSLDDQPMSRLSAPEADVPPQVISETPQAAAPEISEASVTAYRNGDIDALVAELTEGVAPIGTQQGSAAQQPTSVPAIVQPEPLQPVEIAAIGAATGPSSALRNAPGVKISLRPNLRPARFSPAIAQAIPGSGRATLEVDPKSLPAGTRLAQLGAYESAEVARAEWDRIYSRFEDYLAGKQRVIQRAESGGRTFYRLRAMGFEGLSDARRFCSTLVAGKADCIPVTTR
ncbi:MAG: sporulation protein SsgA [Roseobacter sp. MedPE-SW]|nr:MAG: sporulation protein SsgA [Roseobacter sp. MedPE-SW]